MTPNTLMLSAALALSSVVQLSTVQPGFAQEEPALPKLGPNATPITETTDYLRSAPAPDYWAFSAFVKPQFTSSACGVASITAAVNGLAGLPPHAEDTVMRQPELLDAVGDAHWAEISAEGGDGVKFDELVRYAGEALSVAGLTDYAVSSYKPEDASDASLTRLRDWLTSNEQSSEDALLVYFNQGVVTGDWDGPHVSLIGAYDAQQDRVLILEVDQDWYIPYWTPAPILLAAMLKPTSEEHGVLEGQTGGLVRLAPAS